MKMTLAIILLFILVIIFMIGAYEIHHGLGMMVTSVFACFIVYIIFEE